jgi:CBS domain-containing protein
VVSESLEVLGIISVGDALAHLLPSRRNQQDGGDPSRLEPPALTARDVMTRTVMCVSEDQSLVEAANLMVNRDVEQLPVVREGELIGFLTRYATLRRLFGEWASTDRPEAQRTPSTPSSAQNPPNEPTK